MRDGSHPAATAEAAFAPLGDAELVLLTTFRPTGEAVAAPVGVAFADGKAYFMTLPWSGKVARIARDPRVTLAACTRHGALRGPIVEGTARRLDGTEAERARAVLVESVWGRLWLVAARYRDEQPVPCEILPAGGPRRPATDGAGVQVRPMEEPIPR